MSDELIAGLLLDLYRRSPVVLLHPRSRLVVLSDMHLGDGGRKDDFRRNSRLCITALERYYLPKDYTMVLNGDIEELQKFSFAAIRRAWPEFYQILAEFNKVGRLYRIRGNHDETVDRHARSMGQEVLEGIRLSFKEAQMFVFHGHQASQAFNHWNGVVGFFLRHLVGPLGIMNYSVAHDSKRRFRTERRVYDFSAVSKVISLVGHTHRPLFESLSKQDALRFRIEELCRKFPRWSESRRSRAAEEIGRLKSEYDRLRTKDRGGGDGIYGDGLHVPCVFNSGCVVGKRGMTALEIEDESIRLVHWFDSDVSSRYLDHDHPPRQIPHTNFFRYIIKEDPLDYVVARINLLS